ncbi:MAG TPA: class I SAM-dependent methyltransferase [Luteitalea sp.]|nr:class I SAM-dependent methyltransferase [Luteitalea sp.]
MPIRHRASLLVSLLAGLVGVVLLPSAGRAQATQTFEPQFAQPGKDVVWVPTPDVMVDLMLDMAKVTAKDTVVDLGSGDGRMVVAAAKRGARARGVEFNPEMVKLSRQRAYAAGVQERATFVEGDMFEADISDASVMALFLLTENMRRLQPKFLQLRPGTRIVSNTFAMPEWPPDDRRTRGDCTAWCTALLWIVPAPVGGEWQVEGGMRLRLDQHFQKVSGELTGPVGGSTVQGGTVTGAAITFTIGDASYAATVDAGTMIGTRTTGGKPQPWRATRVAAAPSR